MNTHIQHYSEELQRAPNVLGIILFGSWGRGNNRLDSDVDLLVIGTDGFQRTIDYYAGQAFESTYTTEQGAIDYWQANPDEAVEFWRVAQVLFDRDGTVVRLQQVGLAIKEKGKPALTPEHYRHAKFDSEDQLKAIEALATSDQVSARLLLSLNLFKLTELFFDVRQWWTPPPKQRLAQIKAINPDLFDLIQRYQEEQSLPAQIHAVKSIVAIVFDQ